MASDQSPISRKGFKGVPQQRWRANLPPMDRSQVNNGGVGDLALTCGAIISKSERFTQGAAVKFTFQTASNNLVGGYSTDYKLVMVSRCRLARRCC